MAQHVMHFRKKSRWFFLITILLFVNFLMVDKVAVEGSHLQEIDEEEIQENLELPDIYET